MRNKLYLDTTIPSAYYDTSKPIRQLITQKWFENESKKYELFISAITLREINKIKNITKKENIERLIIDYKMKILDFDDKSNILAENYISKGAIPKSEPEDAYHVAIATINNIEYLASWNFSHIVSINPIKKIHEINKKLGYNLIEIGSLDLYGGSKYGNI
jgi:predicted nucleic acid-binding protein